MINYVTPCCVCPVCCVKFSNLTRVLGHLNDTRRRGTRPLACGDIVRAGLVAPTPDDVRQQVVDLARAERKDARKAGRSTPLSRVPAKRPRSDSIVPTSAARDEMRRAHGDFLPFDWSTVRPTKRLKRKTAVDTLLAKRLRLA